jgi:hypothetical protein
MGTGDERHALPGPTRACHSHSDDALTELVLRSEFRNLRDIMSDKPGRAFSSTGGGGVQP